MSRQIMAAIRAAGGFVFKVHGGPTMMAGLPDIVGVYRGFAIAIETKMPGGVVSTVQRLRHDQWADAGGHVWVAHSVAEAMEAVAAIDTMANLLQALTDDPGA